MVRVGAPAAGLLLVGIGALAYEAVRQSRANTERVEYTYQVLSVLELLLSYLKDAETGQRGYLLTGDLRYLEPYHAAVDRLWQDSEQLRQLTTDNPRQQQRLRPLQPLIDSRMRILEQSIVLRQRAGLTPALRLVLTGEGKQLMDEIRSVAAEMRAEEQHLLR